MAPYKNKDECFLLSSCLVGGGRTLLFRVEQVFLLMEEVCSMLMQKHSAQAGERGDQRGEREKKKILKLFCLAIKCEFLFHNFSC